MTMKKRYILLFQYNSISLFVDENGKIKRANFKGNRESLSNCIAFSYEKEDLEFLPDGDPFDVNSNSSFSDYLDFGGYHFETGEAIESILLSIFNDNLIPGLCDDDEIFICTQAFYYERLNRNNNEDIDVRVGSNSYVKNHRVYLYDFGGLMNVSRKIIRRTIGQNVMIGYPLLTFKYQATEKGQSFLIAPTVEQKAVEKVHAKYPLTTHIPEKLLRNIKNRVIISKLYNHPLPKSAIYQNQIIDIAHAKLVEMFDELIKEDVELFLEDEVETNDKPTYIFDFGMHPVIKDSFLTMIKHPVFVDNETCELLLPFIFRLMFIEHEIRRDLYFKIAVAEMEKQIAFREDEVVNIGDKKYYELEYVENYFLSKKKKNNPFNNAETSAMKSAMEKYR